jgi:hypothetical protein
MRVQCDICLENKENLVILEHLTNKNVNHVLCQDCLDKLQTDICPFCRDKIKKIIKINIDIHIHNIPDHIWRLISGMNGITYS